MTTASPEAPRSEIAERAIKVVDLFEDRDLKKFKRHLRECVLAMIFSLLAGLAIFLFMLLGPG